MIAVSTLYLGIAESLDYQLPTGDVLIRAQLLVITNLENVCWFHQFSLNSFSLYISRTFPLISVLDVSHEDGPHGKCFWAHQQKTRFPSKFEVRNGIQVLASDNERNVQIEDRDHQLKCGIIRISVHFVVHRAVVRSTLGQVQACYLECPIIFLLRK